MKITFQYLISDNFSLINQIDVQKINKSNPKINDENMFGKSLLFKFLDFIKTINKLLVFIEIISL